MNNDESIDNKKGKFDLFSDEFKEIQERASNLSVEELSELTQSVGIHFTREEATGEPVDKEEYIRVLNEADSKQKVYDYLEKKGV